MYKSGNKYIPENDKCENAIYRKIHRVIVYVFIFYIQF